MVTNSNLHYHILDHIIQKGYAPNISVLSDLLSATPEEVEKGLIDLQVYHGVVLHPNESKVWVIHPFSLAPTNFIVKSVRGVWWGNCGWCSLGVAALLKEDVVIRSTVGAHGEPISLNIKDGEIQEKDLLIHFPIPMTKAWDNVIYTCSTMLFFRTEDEIDQWSARHDIPKGDIQTVEKVWQFSKKWYGNHLNPEWTKWTKEEAKAMFEAYGLTHPIWELEASKGRF